MSKQTKEAKEAKHFDVDVKVRDFCSKSKVFFIIGLALILISLLSTFTGVNVALEFKGGTIITYSYVGDVDENGISKELTSLVGSTVKVQQGDSLDSDTKTLSLSFTSNDGLTIDRQNDVTNKVKELCPDNEVTLLDANDVNARSGGEFFAKCIVAAVFAALILIIYIAFRFKQISGWSAGVCAVLGLLSTLIVTYGCVVLCRFEIDSNFMAVILTLLGYAVNDTIVIYDRFSAGASSADIRQELECTVSGEVIPPRNLSHSICIKNYDSKHGIETTLRFSYRKNDWYGCTNDWGGGFTFADADFAGYTKAELWAAAPCSQAGVAIYAGEQQLGSVEILPSRSMDDFQLYTIPLKPYTGQADLRLEITGMASVYRIQLG